MLNVLNYTAMVLLLPVLLVLVPLGVSLVLPSQRVAAVTSVVGAAAAWAGIARFAYLSPIPLNEPEWWGGLVIVCTLAGIGVIIGGFARRRQSGSVAD